MAKDNSDVDKICDTIGIKREHSDIVIDGGNVVKTEKTVIMCDKVFRENSSIIKTELIGRLKDLFEVERLIFIPQDPEDYLGHADGMVRFIDENRVFVNNYHSDYQPKFQTELFNSLKKENIEIEKLTYLPDYSSDNAFGHYINYLEIGDHLLMPTFWEMDLSNAWNLNEECKADEMAAIQLEMAFDKDGLKIIDSRDIAKDGGVLNCISWKILKDTN
jgi:agmatine deiminase